MAAPVISSTAKLRLYALTVHSSCASDAPRSSRIVFSALATTSVSRAAISEPMPVSATTHPVEALLVLISASIGSVSSADPREAGNPSLPAHLSCCACVFHAYAQGFDDRRPRGLACVAGVLRPGECRVSDLSGAVPAWADA